MYGRRLTNQGQAFGVKRDKKILVKLTGTCCHIVVRLACTMQKVGGLGHKLKDENYTSEDDLVYVWQGHTSTDIVRIEVMKEGRRVCYRG